MSPASDTVCKLIHSLQYNNVSVYSVHATGKVAILELVEVHFKLGSSAILRTCQFANTMVIAYVVGVPHKCHPWPSMQVPLSV